LEGKIVVWGLNLAGQEDKVASTLGGTYHGPEFQATAIDNLLHGDGRVRASGGLNALVLLGLTVLLGGLAGYVRSRLLPHLVPLLFALLLVVGAYGLFSRGLSIDLFTPLLGIVLTWGGTSIVRVLTEGRRNRWLEGTFGRYLAPSIIEALKRDPALLQLGGRRREITILFSDVADFTRLCESLSPENVVELLNRYLTTHSSAVMNEGGVVDKFQGDAVMAFFGDPVPTADHAYRACRSALEVRARLPDLMPLWEGMGLDGFEIRIGLNTGTAIVGNMGSDQRFDYTCMGDAVNVASRLEGANKAFGSRILIGSRTFEECRAQIVARPIARIVLVGRSEPEPVFELLALKEGASSDLLAHVAAFEAALEAARRGDLEAARRALDEAEGLRPGDGPTAWLRGLVERLAQGEEPSPWSGLVTLTGK
ncbi:MAG: adenylate/guanylate cyclase domain-containing protein, partial [Planctomycetota bacterium]